MAERGLTDVVNVPGEFIPRCGCTADVIAAALGDITIAGKPLTEGHPLIVSIGEEDGSTRVTLNLSAGHRVRVHQQAAVWQAIESAPMDGRVLLVHGTRGVGLGWCMHGRWYWHGGSSLVDVPTHWQPLPQAPSGEGDRS